MQQPFSQLADLGREGGGEEQILTLPGQQGEDLFNVVDETHIEHAIRLVQHQHLQLVETHGVLTIEVEQAARCRHQHIDPLAQAHHLRIDLDPAEDHRGAELEVTPISGHAIAHLGGQFAGGGQHQGAGLVGFYPRTGIEALQQRQGKTGGLAGAGLGRGHHIVTGQHHRNGLLLNR